VLQLIVPALFQTDGLLDLLGEARLPGTDILLARARREALHCSSLEALLCRDLGIARQQDWPLAPIAYAAEGGRPGNDYWLRADPVHVRIERDQLILHEIPLMPADESSALCDALATHFGENFSPHIMPSGAWYVRAAVKPDIATTPLSQAAGRHIDPLLPSGGDAMQWRALLNEAQMLLFGHPLNQAREARGDPAVNSLWLWGGGCLPEASEKNICAVFSDNADWRALAAHAGAEAASLPDAWTPEIPPHALLVLDEPHRCMRRGDFGGWLEAMRNFENGWLQPLIASGRPFRVDDPLQGAGLAWRSIYRWKFWRRAPKPAPQAPVMRQPSADPGIDAFGNRYGEY